MVRENERSPLDPELWSQPAQVLRVYAYGEDAGGWYTNPHGNELPGHRFASLRDARERLGDAYYPPAVMIALRELDGQERIPGEKWAEKDTGRAVAGCLTDMAVMAHMGLVNARVVLDPTESSGSTAIRRTDIVADLRGIIRCALRVREMPESS